MRSYQLVLAAAVCLGFASFSLLTGIENVVVASQPAVGDVAAGRKNVTVFARNAATAAAKAMAQNPGWKVVSVKKINSDPTSMAFRVVLKK
ncbi:MAG: hypothetical protein HOH82_09715 [Planctomycetaceae bacterium]|jgi:hypothetical protein|nr:hypothetical protein [Planctomycetaceae bacterium]